MKGETEKSGDNDTDGNLLFFEDLRQEYEQTIRDAKDRECKMSMNAEALRNVLRSFSDTISSLQLRKFTASTSVTGGPLRRRRP